MGSKTSNGDYVNDTTQVQPRIRKSKIDISRANLDRNYCWACGRSACHLDWSHTVSVADCKKEGKTEQSWNIHNLQRECRECHINWENTPNECKHHINYREKINYMRSYFPEIMKRRILGRINKNH